MKKISPYIASCFLLMPCEYFMCFCLDRGSLQIQFIRTRISYLDFSVPIPHRALSITLQEQIQVLCPLTVKAQIYGLTSVWLPLKHFAQPLLCPYYIYLKVMHASTSCWQYGWRLTFDRNVLDHSLTCCHALSGRSFWLISSLITPPSPSDCFPDFPSLPSLNHSCFTPFLSFSSAPSP